MVNCACCFDVFLESPPKPVQKRIWYMLAFWGVCVFRLCVTCSVCCGLVECSEQAPREPLEAVLGPSGAPLRAQWGPLGAFSGPLGVVLGGVRGGSWGLLGGS